jgi:transposase
MPKNKYPICLSVEEREQLSALISKGTGAARSIRRAHVLLLADENRPCGKLKDKEIARQMQVHMNTVLNIRKAYATQGLQAAIHRKKRTTPPVPPKVTGELEAKIIALSCSEPPAGRTRWTLRLLADKAVELQYIDSISYDTVDRILKKRTQAPSS